MAMRPATVADWREEMEFLFYGETVRDGEKEKASYASIGVLARHCLTACLAYQAERQYDVLFGVSEAITDFCNLVGRPNYGP